MQLRAKLGLLKQQLRADPRLRQEEGRIYDGTSLVHGSTAAAEYTGMQARGPQDQSEHIIRGMMGSDPQAVFSTGLRRTNSRVLSSGRTARYPTDEMIVMHVPGH